MDLACCTIELLGNTQIAILKSINHFNHLLEACIVVVCGANPKTCLVSRHTSGNDHIDDLDFLFVLDQE